MTLDQLADELDKVSRELLDDVEALKRGITLDDMREPGTPKRLELQSERLKIISDELRKKTSDAVSILKGAQQS